MFPCVATFALCVFVMHLWNGELGAAAPGKCPRRHKANGLGYNLRLVDEAGS